MRTDNDVRRAVDELAAESVPVRRALSNLSRRLEPCNPPRRSTRMLPQVLVATVVLAIVAGAGLLSSIRSGSGAQPTASSPVPTASAPCAVTDNPSLDTFAVGAVAGLTDGPVTPKQAWCSGARIRGFFSPTIGQVTVIVYQPGVFSAANVLKQPTVTGHGMTAHTGLLAPDFMVDPGCGVVGASMALPQSRCAASRTVAWEYAPNAWATVSSRRFSTQKAVPAAEVIDVEMNVAAAVEPTISSQYLLPFRISDLADLRPQSLSSTIPDTNVTLSPAGLDQECDPFDGCIKVSVTSARSYAAISPLTGKPTNVSPPSRNVTINGHPGKFYPRTVGGPTEHVDVQAGYWNYTVSTNTQSTGLTATELLDLARRVELAPGQAGTTGWFTAQQALQS